MYPPFAKVRYEELPDVSATARCWARRWCRTGVTGPVLMFALAVIFLPDKPRPERADPDRAGLLHRDGDRLGTRSPRVRLSTPPGWWPQLDLPVLPHSAARDGAAAARRKRAAVTFHGRDRRERADLPAISARSKLTRRHAAPRNPASSSRAAFVPKISRLTLVAPVVHHRG